MYLKHAFKVAISLSFLGCGSVVDRDSSIAHASNDTQNFNGNIINQNRIALYSQGETIYKVNCKGCHGSYGEKKALGKSILISNMKEDTISQALMAYKNGTRNNYGMGALMKGQVATLSDTEISALGVYIYDFNNHKDKLAIKGHNVYNEKYRDNCGISSSNFAAQKSKIEWLKIEGAGTFINELEEICPNISFEKKYEKHLYSFVYKYAYDSGNIVSE